MEIFRERVELFFAHHAALANLAHDRTLVAHSLDNVSCTSLTLCTDEGSTFRDAAESLAEVPGTTDEGNFESMLVNVMLLICRGQDFRLVDVIDANGLQDLT